MRKEINTILILIIIAILASLYMKITHPTIPTTESDKIKVERVIDGDTIELEDGTTVRLIGIDTPESVNPDESKNSEYGTIASEFTKSLLENKYVTLEYDKDAYDKYDRMLAYVYIDDIMVQDILLKNGYAKTMTIRPNTKYADHFKEIENEAKNNNKGFWNSYYKESE